jgi:hypothetical protein
MPSLLSTRSNSTTDKADYVHTEETVGHVAKQKPTLEAISEDVEATRVLAAHENEAAWTEHEEKRLVRKTDYVLLPVVSAFHATCMLVGCGRLAHLLTCSPCVNRAYIRWPSP